MIKSIPVGPRRKGSFPSGHEDFLKARHRLNPALGIPRGDHATLARVVASEGDVADPEKFEFLRPAEKTVFPERLHHVEFKIRPESATRSFECQPRKPTSDLLQTPFTDNRRTGRQAIIGKAAGGLADELNGESKKSVNHRLISPGSSRTKVRRDVSPWTQKAASR